MVRRWAGGPKERGAYAKGSFAPRFPSTKAKLASYQPCDFKRERHAALPKCFQTSESDQLWALDDGWAF